MSKHNKHKRAFLIWLAIYPLITMLLWLLGDRLTMYPLGVRTFILTALAVPIVSYLLLPAYSKLFTKWLNEKL